MIPQLRAFSPCCWFSKLLKPAWNLSMFVVPTSSTGAQSHESSETSECLSESEPYANCNTSNCKMYRQAFSTRISIFALFILSQSILFGSLIEYKQTLSLADSWLPVFGETTSLIKFPQIWKKNVSDATVLFLIICEMFRAVLRVFELVTEWIALPILRSKI